MSGGFHWDLGSLPFMWNPLRTPHNPEGLPDTLPFALTMNEATGALMQAPSAQVSAALARAYQLGSMISGQMDETGIGRGYTDDFLAFIRESTGADRFDGKRILEIGCGNGYLLHRLRELGATVQGLEPGEHGQAKYDVPIVRDFFPSPAISGKFDVVVMFGVLEHLEQPRALLEQIFPMLENNGLVLLAVPDCAPYLEVGDLSCLIHEHWSYFDDGSLAETLRVAGGAAIAVVPGRFGGMLYARMTAGGAPHHRTSVAAARVHAFRERAARARDALAGYFGSAQVIGRSIGVYVPGRVINALFASGVRTDRCRFFDDNPLLHGTYFPGLAIPVENRASLMANPTDQLLVMSRSFGEKIAAELGPTLPPDVAITTWRGLFERA